MINLVKVCRELNTWGWDILEDLPMYTKESTLAKIAAHVFEPEDIEDIISDIDVVDFEWYCDHSALTEHENMATYIACRAAQAVTKTNFTFYITRSKTWTNLG